MATYETRKTGIKGQTEVLVKTGIAKVPEGWQNLTPEKAASYPFIAGYVLQDGNQWHATSMAMQAFRRLQWTQNEGQDFGSEREALDWIVAKCNEELAVLG